MIRLPAAMRIVAAVGVMSSITLPAGLLVAQTQQFVPRDESPEDLPAGAGRDDTFYACTACHGFKLIAQQGMNRRQWEESLEQMVSKHNMAPLPDKDRKIVLDYLEATYPPRSPRGWQNPFAPR